MIREMDMNMPEVLYQAKRFRVERVTQESADGSRHARTSFVIRER